VHGAPAVLDSGDRHALPASAEMADASIQTATQHVSTTVDAAQFAKPAVDADVDKALDHVVEELRAVEGLEKGRLVGHASKGFASANFARLVEEAVKTKLKAEAKGLIKAKLVGKAAPRGEFDRFALNAAAAVETALGLVYEALRQRWEAKARPGVVENYAHVLEKSPRGLKVYKRDVTHYLRYDVGDIAYGGVKAEGVVVLVFLGGEKSIRVEVLAKSVANAPVRFEEKEWDGGRWLRLATAIIAKSNGVEKYMARIELKFIEKPKVEVNGRAAGVEGLRGLLMTDAPGKRIGTPDPLLIKLFTHHFEKAEVEVAGVSLTKAGFSLQFRAEALDDKPFEELFGDIAKRYGRGLWFIVDKAREMWRETVRKLHNDIKRVADEAAEVGRREGVEAGRRVLVEGLRHLFEEREQEALGAGRLDDALAIAVAGRLMVGIVYSPREWFSLLAGDGVVDIGGKTLGFSAKYAEVAEAVLRLLAVWAGAYEAEIRVKKRENFARYASSEDAAKVLGAVLKGDVLEYAMSLAKSWIGLAGSDAPKVISLLALAQLLGVVEGKWAVELWLAHKAATAPVEPEVAEVLDRFFARVESVDRGSGTGGNGEEVGVNLSFKVRGLEGVSRAVTLRLYTDFRHFRLYCDSCISETSARRVLETVAEWLRLAVERLAAEKQKWPRWYGNALVLPADVGWPIFLELWKKYNMSLPIRDGGRELLRVEVLEARADGTAKFRLWYYKWRETRPDRPYVDVEIKSYQYKDGKVRFFDHVFANEAKGILREHLAEIAKLLKREGVEGVTYQEHEKKAYLQSTGRFRDSVLRKLGVKPELPRGEPLAVQHLGGFKFRVGGQEVEFRERAEGARREFYAELKFPSREGAVRFAASLRAIGVDARIAGSERAGYTVRLDSDSFFGLLAAADATLPGLKPLYRSDDFRVYASVEEGRMRFNFAVKHEGVWKATEGVYNERSDTLQLRRAERDVLDAIRDAVAKALEKLDSERQSRPAKVGEPKEEKGERGNVEVYYLLLYGHHLAAFLEHAAERVEAKPAEVLLEGRRIVISAGDVKAEVEFKLLKRSEAVSFPVQDVERTLALYKMLKQMGVRVEITPGGVKVDREAMWALAAATVEKAVEKGELGRLPTEVMPGVELLKVYNAGGVRMYVFRVSEEDVHYYFTVKTEEGYRAAGGKYVGKQVQIAGEAAPILAEAINAIYREMGVERRVEVRYDKKGTPYARLANVDLELLNLRQAAGYSWRV